MVIHLIIHHLFIHVTTRNQYTYVLYVNVFHTRIVLRIAYEILPPPSVTHFSLLSFRIHRDGISPVVGKTVSYYGYFVVNHSEKKKKCARFRRKALSVV